MNDSSYYTYCNATNEEKQRNYIIAMKERLEKLKHQQAKIEQDIIDLTQQIKDELNDITT